MFGGHEKRERSVPVSIPCCMSSPEDLDQFLQLCMWDIAAGARQLYRRLPGVAEHAEDAGLQLVLSELASVAGMCADRLFMTGGKHSGPDNLWMAGILDDAERDTRTIAPGPLLDLAIVGAVRKALQAKLASIDTAHATARALEDSTSGAALKLSRAEAEVHDRELADLLDRLAAQAARGGRGGARGRRRRVGAAG
jgi:hypothetical protein